jgi:hypothetical protein
VSQENRWTDQEEEEEEEYFVNGWHEVSEDKKMNLCVYAPRH